MRRFENVFTAWLLVLVFTWTSVFSASGVIVPPSKNASGDFFANSNEQVWENEPPALIPCRENRLGSTTIASGVLIMSFYSHDGLGSVRGLTDAIGTSLGNYHYDAYGLLIENTVSVANPYLFAGERFDNDLGLYYLRARYLDVETGRFWSLDEYEGGKYEAMSLHKYLYAHANPVSMIDPSGHFSLQEQAAVIGQRTSSISLRLKTRAKVAKKALDKALQFIVGISLKLNVGVAAISVSPIVSGKALKYSNKLFKAFKRRSRISKKTRKRVFRIARFIAKITAKTEAAKKLGVPISVNGLPNFDKFVHPRRGTVFIELTGSRSKDKRRARSARRIADPIGYTWHHHEAMGVMQLVKNKAHKLSHSGGVFFYTIVKDKDYN